jgi:hypothetical protein
MSCYKDILDQIDATEGCQYTKEKIIDILQQYEGSKIYINKRDKVNRDYLILMKRYRCLTIKRIKNSLNVSLSKAYRLTKMGVEV